ncbi:hypothetical protein [Streptomyces sp. NPDC056844]|uniref:hypothetical protein n=1 Tax=unclassified Streptomyces TaxID=2593676 RepID=UPI00367C6F69
MRLRTEEPVVPVGAIDPPGAITADITGTDAVLFETGPGTPEASTSPVGPTSL